MPRPGPRRENTAVRMSDEQRRDLDRLAKLDGTSASEQVRRAVDEYRTRRRAEMEEK